ncbi:hypothetical protein QYF36_002684 [Acer negundo]|nr:hypothetical protein QYF36_002684 [Acer negundo]
MESLHLYSTAASLKGQKASLLNLHTTNNATGDESAFTLSRYTNWWQCGFLVEIEVENQAWTRFGTKEAAIKMSVVGNNVVVVVMVMAFSGFQNVSTADAQNGSVEMSDDGDFSF